jgi:hypothetical protein
MIIKNMLLYLISFLFLYIFIIYFTPNTQQYNTRKYNTGRIKLNFKLKKMHYKIKTKNKNEK